MNTSQLNNLIGFCFNFHETNGINLESCNADYVLEKWSKFIGVEPEKIKSKLKKRESISLDEWVKKWGSENYDKVKEILHFIEIINLRPFTDTNPTIVGFGMWSPSELINEFENWIGDSNKINKEQYNHTHEVLKLGIVKWLNKTENKRDYNLNLLV